MSEGLWSVQSITHDSMCWKWRVIYRWWLLLVDRSTYGHSVCCLICHLGGYEAFNNDGRVSLACELPLLRTHGECFPENRTRKGSWAVGTGKCSVRRQETVIPGVPDQDAIAIHGWGSLRESVPSGWVFHSSANHCNNGHLWASSQLIYGEEGRLCFPLSVFCCLVMQLASVWKEINRRIMA